jgi:hypothetical protein
MRLSVPDSQSVGGTGHIPIGLQKRPSCLGDCGVTRAAGDARSAAWLVSQLNPDLTEKSPSSTPLLLTGPVDRMALH